MFKYLIITVFKLFLRFMEGVVFCFFFMLVYKMLLSFDRAIWYILCVCVWLGGVCVSIRVPI